MMGKYPPRLVRLMARRKIGFKRVVALSNEELAIRSGLPPGDIKRISQELSWDKVTFGEAKRFIEACSFDPTSSADRNRVSAYIRQDGGPRFRYLRESPLWDSYFKPLMAGLKR